jgi:hypothetical protein
MHDTATRPLCRYSNANPAACGCASRPLTSIAQVVQAMVHQRGCLAQAHWLPCGGGEVGVGRHEAPVVQFVDLWRENRRGAVREC